VSGALQFIHTHSAGVLGKFWGKGASADADADAGADAVVDTEGPSEGAAVGGAGTLPPPPAITTAAKTVAATAAATATRTIPAPPSPQGDCHEDSFTDDAQAKFVMVDLNAPSANTKAP
jgi:hypothetical protein